MFQKRPDPIHVLRPIVTGDQRAGHPAAANHDPGVGFVLDLSGQEGIVLLGGMDRPVSLRTAQRVGETEVVIANVGLRRSAISGASIQPAFPASM